LHRRPFEVLGSLTRRALWWNLNLGGAADCTGTGLGRIVSDRQGRQLHGGLLGREVEEEEYGPARCPGNRSWYGPLEVGRETDGLTKVRPSVRRLILVKVRVPCDFSVAEGETADPTAGEGDHPFA